MESDSQTPQEEDEGSQNQELYSSTPTPSRPCHQQRPGTDSPRLVKIVSVHFQGGGRLILTPTPFCLYVHAELVVAVDVIILDVRVSCAR